MASIGASDEETEKAGGLIPTAIAVAILTLVGGGGGAVLGMMLASPEPAAATTAPAETPGAEIVDIEAGDLAESAEKLPLKLMPLKPVLTNIYSPPQTWLRVEAALVYRDDGSADPEVLAAQIEADTLAFLRSVQLSQVEGTRGLMHLREDLRQRAKLRSPAVVDYLIQTMIAE
ncbi:flagellar basal body-associated FliL family protein [Aurantimonas manganoxydans]|uniref:flagellar basal body-associated FliL family protein n=1 Tax=Aurantimonas manganoxydans TaxID=651183 RepID=UPI0002F33DBA|nr:flagellar basal body-associated FliL family protein [Aurantimonas manganoxydans]